MTMQSEPVPSDSFDQIPGSVLLRWMMKAALFGLFVGVAVGIAVLQG
jgi:hypothetical protein